MSHSELEALSRAHQLFAGGTRPASLNTGSGHYRDLLGRAARLNDGFAHGGYRLAVQHSRQRLASTSDTDAAVTDLLVGAHRDRTQARELTGAVLDAGRADAAAIPTTPLAQREAMRRRVMRLRTQHAHVVSA
ncbi:hypothetical protein BB737_11515, partial [Mycobacterium avium subsp. hominissuis]